MFENEYVWIMILGFLACWESDKKDAEEENKL